MSNISNHKKEDCCGCTACAMVCPTKAITLTPDEEGYLYPSLNEDLCVNCAACERVCPMTNRQEGSCIDVIAAKAKDDNERFKSTSGAIFPILARSVLSQGGMVAGAVFDDHFSVVHILSSSEADIKKMRGSKYVQSRLDDLFDTILKQVSSRKVMFTGTPCQCEGLRQFVTFKKGNLDNLIICDLVCDGVPSLQLWCDYVSYLESCFGSKLSYFCFRNKKEGWSYNTQSAVFGEFDKSKLVNSKFSWIQMFTNPAARRSSCYHCPYTDVKRNSDLTIGDFWGIEESIPGFADNLGVSLILIHSEKGKKLWNNICEQTEWSNSTIEKCKQKRLLYPVNRPVNREMFWNLYRNKGIKGILNKYGKRSSLKRFVYKRILPITKQMKIYDALFSLYHNLTKK